MCWNCDRPGSTFADYVEQWLLPTIDRHGWAVTAVDGDRLHAPFAYTIGLTEQGLPELVITGLRQERAHEVLQTLARHSIGVEELVPGERRNVCGSDQLLEIVAVPHPEAHLFDAVGLYGPDVHALQLVWEDDRGRWPWDVGFRGFQPVFGPRNRG
jgi:hypothetical protein